MFHLGSRARASKFSEKLHRINPLSELCSKSNFCPASHRHHRGIPFSINENNPGIVGIYGGRIGSSGFSAVSASDIRGKMSISHIAISCVEHKYRARIRLILPRPFVFFPIQLFSNQQLPGLNAVYTFGDDLLSEERCGALAGLDSGVAQCVDSPSRLLRRCLFRGF